MKETSPVTMLESKRLIALEKVIQSGLSTFVSVGEALAEIRESRLYRIEFDNFDEYCRSKWNMSRIQAHRLTAAAEISEMLPIGNKPTGESQVRPLSKLDTEEEQKEAWKEAVEESGGKPTAKHVEAAVSRRMVPEHQFTPAQLARIEEAKGDSEQLWLVKSNFRKLNKKDRAAFIKWAQSNQ